jgi:asparagine N-glycosylation enzyme membrane subunit Stt3
LDRFLGFLCILTLTSRLQAFYSYYNVGLREGGEAKMLGTIAIILIALWLLGFVSSYTMGGFVHVLLVIAVVVLLIRVIQGRRLV